VAGAYETKVIQMIDIVIPIQEDTKHLELTVASVQKYTTDYKLHIIKDKTINVSEARQQALDNPEIGPYLIYLDDDTIILYPKWSDYMLETMQKHPDAGAVFAGEWWGTEPEVIIQPREHDTIINYGPAACMLIDKRKLTPFTHWDQKIGLRNHWLGGDFEEVDFCYRLRHIGLRCYRCTSTCFHHAGDKTTMEAFQVTDRAKTARTMSILIHYKYHKFPTDEDFFKDLQYIRASDDDMNMMAPDTSLRRCYHKVIGKYNLQHLRPFRQNGLI